MWNSEAHWGELLESWALLFIKPDWGRREEEEEEEEDGLLSVLLNNLSSNEPHNLIKPVFAYMILVTEVNHICFVILVVLFLFFIVLMRGHGDLTGFLIDWNNPIIQSLLLDCGKNELDPLRKELLHTSLTQWGHIKVCQWILWSCFIYCNATLFIGCIM